MTYPGASRSTARPLKPYSTRRFRKPPPEFERYLVECGWSKVNRVYGKRAAQRYYEQLGPERLKAARKRWKDGLTAVNGGADTGDDR